MTEAFTPAKVVTTIAYLCASIFFLYHSVRPGTKRSKAAWLGFALLLIGFAAESFAMVKLTASGYPPFRSLVSALIGLSLCFVGVGAVFIITLRFFMLGLYVAPLAFVTSVAALLLTPESVAGYAVYPPDISRTAIAVHAFLGYAGYAAFFAAALGGAMYLIQERQLRRKQLGLLFEHLPPLERSGRIISVGIVAGLVLMTVAIAIAMISFRHFVPVGELLADANFLSVVVLWVYALVVLVLSLKQGWVGKQTAYLTIFLGIAIFAFQVIFAFHSTTHQFSVQ